MANPGSTWTSPAPPSSTPPNRFWMQGRAEHMCEDAGGGGEGTLTRRELGQKLARSDDCEAKCSALLLRDVEEIVVTGYHECCAAASRGGEKQIVVRVFAGFDARTQIDPTHRLP